jgi:hypothetical protein
MKGEPEAALDPIAQEGFEALRVQGQALALYALGRREEHQAKLDELIERWGDQWPFTVAHVYAYMADTDRAFEWLNKSVQEKAGQFEPTDHRFESLANDRAVTPLSDDQCMQANAARRYRRRTGAATG